MYVIPCNDVTDSHIVYASGSSGSLLVEYGTHD